MVGNKIERLLTYLLLETFLRVAHILHLNITRQLRVESTGQTPSLILRHLSANQCLGQRVPEVNK